MKRWRTRLDPAHSRLYGCDELHVAAFEHRDDPGGTGCCVGLQVPEANDQQINIALRVATARRARVLVIADTAAQVEALAARIALCCAQHRRVPQERAAAGQFGPVH